MRFSIHPQYTEGPEGPRPPGLLDHASYRVVHEPAQGRAIEHGAAMAQLTAPGQVPPPVRRREVNRVAARIRSTPGRMVVVMLVLLLVGLLAGIAWAIGSAQRSSSAGGARTGSGELAVQAQELYRA